MNLNSISPEPPLDRLIHTFVHYTDYRPDHQIERVIPDGCAYLLFALDGMPRRIYDNDSLVETAVFQGAWFSGPHDHYISIEALQDSAMVAIRFAPGGAFPVLHNSLELYANRIVDATDAFGIEIDTVRTELVSSSDIQEAWRIVESWLALAMKPTRTPPNWIDAAISGISHDPTFAQTTLSEIVEMSGHSQKQFIQQFKRHVGLTPKTFQRILRFNEILPRIVDRRQVSWTDISYECGYYDQSHFIREFRRFSGYNPAEFLRGPTSQRINFFPVG